MTQIFDETRAVPVTVIKAGPCVVTQVKHAGADGYEAVQLAYGEHARAQASPSPTQGPLRQGGRRAAAPPGRAAHRRRRTYEPARRSRADVSRSGDKVDVVGVSKGKGFTGV